MNRSLKEIRWNRGWFIKFHKRFVWRSISTEKKMVSQTGYTIKM